MAAPAQLQYSIAEKVDILLAYVSAQKDAQLASMLYAAQHPGRRVPARSTFVSVFNRFRTTGSVHAQRRKRPASATDVFDIDVLAYVAVRPEASVREIASAYGASPASVWRSLSRHSYHPYHLCLHQELRPSDFKNGLIFATGALFNATKIRNSSTECFGLTRPNFVGIRMSICTTHIIGLIRTPTGSVSISTR